MFLCLLQISGLSWWWSNGFSTAEAMNNQRLSVSSDRFDVTSNAWGWGRSGSAIGMNNSSVSFTGRFVNIQSHSSGTQGSSTAIRNTSFISTSNLGTSIYINSSSRSNTAGISNSSIQTGAGNDYININANATAMVVGGGGVEVAMPIPLASTTTPPSILVLETTPSRQRLLVRRHQCLGRP